MWMAYQQESEIKDERSAVEYLRQQFSNLQFDAEHEAVYGMGRFYTEEECSKIAKTYDLGMQACDDYLEGQLCIYCFVQRLQAFQLECFLRDIVDYLPENLKKSAELETDENNPLEEDNQSDNIEND